MEAIVQPPHAVVSALSAALAETQIVLNRSQVEVDITRHHNEQLIHENKTLRVENENLRVAQYALQLEIQKVSAERKVLKQLNDVRRQLCTDHAHYQDQPEFSGPEPVEAVGGVSDEASGFATLS